MGNCCGLDEESGKINEKQNKKNWFASSQ